MAAFDLEKSYIPDHELVDFLDEASLEIPNDTETPTTITGLHVRREDLNTTEFRNLAAGLSLSSSAAAFVVWGPTDEEGEPVELNIVQGSVIRLDDDGTGWLVQAHERSRFGHYVMLCSEELTNAAT